MSISRTMALRKALNLPETPVLAIVGSGGKTSLLFRLAKEYTPRVIVSNTAHLGVNQAENADKVVQLREPQDIPRILDETFDGILLITGLPDERGRYRGLEHTAISLLIDVCKQKRIPLLIEADGCRGKPLKAPAPWEPPIPQKIEQVIVCAGASGFGKPLNEEWVYRSADYSQLTNVPLGDLLSSETIAKVISHPLGGLKNIPENSKRYFLINQADSVEQQEFGGDVAIRILSKFDRGVVASLHGTEYAKPVEIHRVYAPVAGVILAAGESRRFGSPKVLIEIEGEPLVHRIAKIALESYLQPVLVVTGAYPEISSNLSNLDVNIVENPSWKLGQSSSVKVAINALPEHVQAVIFLLGDQPFITSSLLKSLLHAFAISQAPIIAPMVNGQRANPILFSRETFHDLMNMTGDAGGRQIFEKFPLQFIPWEDEKLLFDIDTLDDLAKLMKLIDHSSL